MSPAVRKGLVGAAILVAAIDLALEAAGLMQGHAAAESLPLFGAAAGFLAALAIAGLAKLLGKLLLSRPENYYD